MVQWHHQFKGHEFEQTPRGSERQGSLVCCSPWVPKESEKTEGLNNNKVIGDKYLKCIFYLYSLHYY